MSATLIINAQVVNEGRIVEADVRLRDGRIAQIGQGLTCYGDEELVDAAGCYLLPGLIDDGARSEAGPEYAAACVAGGVTSCLGLSAAAAAGLVNHAGATPRADLADGADALGLLAALDAVRDGRDRLEALVERAVHAKARLHRLHGRGFVVEDGWADLVLVDLETPSHAADGTACVQTTWVNGEKVWNAGSLLDARPGQALVLAD
jgi:dihydroorotase-like cyclic amidohydrolase